MELTTGVAWGDLMVGMYATYSQTITDADVKGYAGLSGDHNPVHLDEEFAAKSKFRKRIAHGMISSSFFSALFGTKLPGPGCVYASQSLQFKRPVYLGDTVVAKVEIVSIEQAKQRVFFRTTCTVKNRIVIDGEAEIYIP